MKQRRLFALLLTPSLSSAVIAIVFTGIIFATTVWNSYKSYPVIKEYIADLQQISASVGSSYGASEAFQKTVLSSPGLNQAFFIIFWALVGLIAYLLTSAVWYWIKDSADELAITTIVRKKHERFDRLKGYLTRIAIRLTIFLLWFVHSVVFIQFLVPTSILSIQVSALLGWGANWIQGLGGVVIMLISIHLHTIFLRLAFLRPRVFGNVDDVTEST